MSYHIRLSDPVAIAGAPHVTHNYTGSQRRGRLLRCTEDTSKLLMEQTERREKRQEEEYKGEARQMGQRVIPEQKYRSKQTK